VVPPLIFFFFWMPAPIYLGLWIIMQIAYAFYEIPGVAWWAHIGGFVLGLVVILFMRPKRNYRADPYWECLRDFC
jgi:membrane associated rhomboid family serine protease